MSKICPRCGNTLTPRNFGAGHLDGCEQCGGMWFDRDELNRITRDPSVGLIEVERAFCRAIPAEQCHGEMKCPNCAVSLAPFTFPHSPNIPLHFCRQCKGIWLDEGEMEAIANRIASARKPATPPPPPPPTTGELRRQQTRNVVGFLLSIPCPACNTTNPVSSLVCWACGKPLQAREILHLCPRCDIPLTEVEVAWMHLDACPQCAGVWLAEGRLPVFLQLDVHACARVRESLVALCENPHVPHHARLARCPACHYEMHLHLFGSEGSVEINICSHCKSVWLDAGQLMAAYELVQREGFLCLRGGEADIWSRD